MLKFLLILSFVLGFNEGLNVRRFEISRNGKIIFLLQANPPRNFNPLTNDTTGTTHTNCVRLKCTDDAQCHLNYKCKMDTQCGYQTCQKICDDPITEGTKPSRPSTTGTSFTSVDSTVATVTEISTTTSTEESTSDSTVTSTTVISTASSTVTEIPTSTKPIVTTNREESTSDSTVTSTTVISTASSIVTEIPTSTQPIVTTNRQESTSDSTVASTSESTTVTSITSVDSIAPAVTTFTKPTVTSFSSTILYPTSGGSDGYGSGSGDDEDETTPKTASSTHGTNLDEGSGSGSGEGSGTIDDNNNKIFSTDDFTFEDDEDSVVILENRKLTSVPTFISQPLTTTSSRIEENLVLTTERKDKIRSSDKELDSFNGNGDSDDGSDDKHERRNILRVRKPIDRSKEAEDDSASESDKNIVDVIPTYELEAEFGKADDDYFVIIDGYDYQPGKTNQSIVKNVTTKEYN